MMKLFPLLALWAAVTCGTVAWADAPAEWPAVPPPDREQVEQWVADLNSDNFAAREAATRKLIRAGKAAVEPLAEVARGSDLEVTTRAIHILQELYKSQDDEAIDAAELGFSRLLESEHPSVLARVEQVLIANSGIRQRRALAHIERLGGTIRYVEGIGISGEEDGTFDRSDRLISYILLGKNWKGGDAGLDHIRRLPSLTTLYVTRGTEVTEEALAKLVEDLPRLEIQRRGRACLGVAGANDRQGCHVISITENSAAEEAGLQSGDIIVEFDGREVADFQQLVQVLGEKEVEDEVMVKLVRNGQVLTKKIVLRSWEATGRNSQRPR